MLYDELEIELKRIDLSPKPIKATAFRFNITAAAAWPVAITNFAAFKPCGSAL